MTSNSTSNSTGGRGVSIEQLTGDAVGTAAGSSAGPTTRAPTEPAAGQAAGGRVVLVHGFTQSSRSWDPIATRLEATGVEVLAWDVPGHGDSPKVPAGLDLPGAAEMLGEAGGRATYVGYSLGARICLQLAILRPELVERMVLAGVTAGIEDLDEREERRAADERLACELDGGGEAGLPQWIDRWLSGPLFAHLTAEHADRESRLRNTAAGLAAALRCLGTGTQRPLWEDAGAIGIPVLIVAGELDPKFTELGQRLAQAIGINATFVLVPGSGHAAPFEAPGPFAEMVGAFARGQGLAGPG